MASSNTLCGLSWLGYPKFLQRFANTKTFILVYGLLGTVQSMGFVYFAITLQTMEKRFKIPSQTTGLILSGNEVSQILLSVVLAYFGGQRNRPRLIAWGVLFCSLSCFILALPHFLYGAGEDALRLTKEYMDASNATTLDNTAADVLFRKSNRMCMKEEQAQECYDEIDTIVPLVLIFLSQFVLGIGNTLYYALGQTYLDDNTKKTNTPLLLSYAFALRTAGPAVGFVLGFFSLKIFIDPTKTPLIDSSDPRWMGAWWFGWVLLGFALLVVCLLVGMFPKELPKKRKDTERPISNDIPKSLRSGDAFDDESTPMNKNSSHDDQFYAGRRESVTEIPTFKQFPAAMARLFKNKLLMFNVLSGIFYILGASAYFTFMSKYLEVQFHKSAADATIVTGPLTILGVVIGLLGSGYVISKLKPSPSKVLMWNVIVGFGYMAGQISNLYFTCPDGQTPMEIQNGRLNLSSACNLDCHCTGFAYTPVCWEETGDTFFNPCVANCNAYNKEKKFYHQCECARELPKTTSLLSTFKPTLPLSVISSTTEYSTTFASLNSSQARLVELEVESATPTITVPSTPAIILPPVVQKESGQEVVSSNSSDSDYPVLPPDDEYDENNYPTLSENIGSRSGKLQDGEMKNSKEISPEVQEPEVQESPKKAEKPEDTDYDYGLEDEYENQRGKPADSTEKFDARFLRKREAKFEPEVTWGKLVPGACIKGCAFGFYAFSLVSSIINCFGASGRIGTILVNYRCVSKQDKSVTQGLILMLISLFALIPGPIMFGRIIDSTCLVWTEQCSGRRGNCQLYDQRKFRYYINLTAFFFTAIGVFFDYMVYRNGKNLDLYGEREEEMLKKQQQKNATNGRN